LRPAAISTDAKVTSRAKRSGRIAASEPRERPLASGATAGAALTAGTNGGGSPRWASISDSTRRAASSTSSGGPAMRPRKSSAHEISSRGIA
jgi:hypothetical protein